MKFDAFSEVSISNLKIDVSQKQSRIITLLLLMLFLPCLMQCSAARSATVDNPQTPSPTTPQISSSSTKAPKLATSAFPDAQVGTAYNAAPSVSGGKTPYQFTIGWGKLPSGLSLSSKTGKISGMPRTSGPSKFGIRVVDSAGNGDAGPFQINVSEPLQVSVSVSPDNASITSLETVQFTAVVSHTSNVAVTWSASNGQISASGLYTAPAVTANTTVTVKALSAADPTKTATAVVNVTAPLLPPVAINTTAVADGTAGVAYSATLNASGGSVPYNWALTSGTLPGGMSLKGGGSLSGTPTQTGQFNFTVQVSDSASPPQMDSQDLILVVSKTPAAGNTITLSFFGADFNSGKLWPPTDGQNQTATLGALRIWDSGAKWGQLNTADSVYNWKPLDNWLDKAQSQGLDVLYTFGDTPQFAAGANPPAGCLQPGEYSCAPPVDVNADGTGTDAHFQAFVTALVTHATGRIAYYELWNEPDYNGFWGGTTAQLVRMGKDAAAIIRSLAPSAKIISPSAHGPSMATWFDEYVAAGGAPNFDIVNVHMRGSKSTNATPEAFLTVYGQVQSELQKRNLTNLPVWDDEYGILAGQGLTDPDMLAGFIARAVLLRAGVGLQRQYVYFWDSPSSAYGMQGNAAGTAWNQVAKWLIGHSISPCTVTGSVYKCALDNGEVVWDTAQSCSNGACTYSNYTYPAACVWYYDIAGNRTALSGKSVEIGYKPIFLENQ